MEDDILTIEEVAKYLRVSERTVYDWAQKGEIPSGKIGTVWRFKKSEIEKWVNERLSSGGKSNDSEIIVQVKNILSPERIVFMNHQTKHDSLVRLAQNLATAPQVKDAKENEAKNGIPECCSRSRTIFCFFFSIAVFLVRLAVRGRISLAAVWKAPTLSLCSHRTACSIRPQRRLVLRLYETGV